MFGLGTSEIILILLVILLLFGAKRIPELARAIGKASFEFKKAKENIIKEGEELVNEAENTAAVEAAVEKKAGKKSKKHSA